jgi:bifunctional ADP-heptose synthase (sugar kinase/adenylyltransferase)
MGDRFAPLDTDGLNHILQRIPALTLGVVGDLFLDRYLDIDAALTEPSLETGLEAYQVVRVRPSPGAAGTVINNLVALGVGRVCPVAVVGDDGEGYELRQALARLNVVELQGVLVVADRRTPTYTKPLLHEAGSPARELNRLDIKNRVPMPPDLEGRVREVVAEVWARVDALVVLDQVSEDNCGVITAGVRDHLSQLASTAPSKFILADSRERIGLFRDVCLKPNRHEVLRAVAGEEDLEGAVLALARRAGRLVFCTDGARGTLVVRPQDDRDTLRPWIAGYPVRDPIDPVGAGDSASAGIVCALATGAGAEAAAAFGNLMASITIQQLGTTGTATAEQVRQRWGEIV